MKNVFLKPQTVYQTTAPYKYQKIDNFISRSAQPNKNNINDIYLEAQLEAA